jgi:lipopolysaccharide biosynthesis glycosyltransferase
VILKNWHQFCCDFEKLDTTSLIVGDEKYIIALEFTLITVLNKGRALIDSKIYIFCILYNPK